MATVADLLLQWLFVFSPILYSLLIATLHCNYVINITEYPLKAA
ncbi:MAG: hypothetical protein ACYC46_13440 [Acidobacteriaceae bacterium]